MENANTGYHQHSHRRSNYSRSYELHVEKAARENARPQGVREIRKSARRSCGFAIRRQKGLDLFNADLQSASSENQNIVWRHEKAYGCGLQIRKKEVEPF